ncbi:MAG TPA: PQQ-like beta-propeller repeat protein [Caldisericia bacterium]|nr:PQQ-like beta-propeller repeat protein [Caldisericia bacterium]
MMKKKISAVLLLVFLVSFSAVLQSCTTENQSSDLSKVEHITIEKEDTVGFRWIDWTKPDINQEAVHLNWKLSLEESSKDSDWYYYDNHFWLLDEQGNLFHIDVPTGNITYNHTLETWRYITAHDKDMLFMIGKQDDGTFEIQAYLPKRKKIVWTKSLEDQTELFLGRHIVDGVLYITNSKGVLFAIRIKDGAELWRFDAQEEIRSDVFVDKDILFFTCKDSTCYAIDRSNGKPLWKRHQDFFMRQNHIDEYSVFAGIDGMIGYYGNTYEPFRLVEATTGKLLWEYPYSTEEIQPYIEAFLQKTEEEKRAHKWPSWRIQLFRQPFSVQNTVVLVFWTDYQANIHVLDPFSKNVLWKKEWIRFCFPTIDDKILIGRYENEEDSRTIVFEKIDPLTGSIIWSKTDKSILEYINVQGINFQDIVTQMKGQYILGSDFNGNLFLIDTEDGNLMWGYSSNNGGDYINIRVHENIFFAEQRGTNSIYCFSIAK